MRRPKSISASGNIDPWQTIRYSQPNTTHTQRSHRKQKACINLRTPIGDDGVNRMRMLPILQRLGVAYGL